MNEIEKKSSYLFLAFQITHRRAATEAPSLLACCWGKDCSNPITSWFALFESHLSNESHSKSSLPFCNPAKHTKWTPFCSDIFGKLVPVKLSAFIDFSLLAVGHEPLSTRRFLPFLVFQASKSYFIGNGWNNLRDLGTLFA